MTRIKIYAAAVVAFIAALGVAFLRGAMFMRGKDKAKENEEYIDTRKKIDDVDPVPDADEWLSERIKRRDL